ncbi:MAG: hypothetical protein RRZ84_01445 [Romboutsia sp.]
MIKLNVVEEEKRVYVDVSGYISSNDTKRFVDEYKKVTKQIKGAQYKLVVTPEIFECENNNDMRTICMTFYKSGYKKMYLVDPNNYIFNTMSLGHMEKKMFSKAVKIISHKDNAR